MTEETDIEGDARLFSGAKELPPWLVAGYVRRHARARGASDASILLQDFGQRALIPLTDEAVGQAATAAQNIDGTLAGRAFSTSSPVMSRDGETLRLFLPLLEGGDRVGVLGLSLPQHDDQQAMWEEFAAAVTALVVTKGQQTDVYFRARRREDMSVAAEMQWHLLPPLSLLDPRLAVAGLLEPAYHVGGDAFDYAINQETAHIAIFDAMGHGLAAAVMAGVAVACYRHGRRAGAAVEDLYSLIDAEFCRQFPTDTFVTAQLANLHLTTGLLTLVNAGHPPALHLRGRRVLGPITGPVTLPIGLQGAAPQVVATHLEPGDRLLFYTDGVTEQRSQGDPYGEQHLAGDLEVALSDDVPAPEIVRRLHQRLRQWRGGRDLQDDATVVLAEWRTKDLGLPQ